MNEALAVVGDAIEEGRIRTQKKVMKTTLLFEMTKAVKNFQSSR